MLEGGILCFEQEELALRFMKLVSDAVTKTLSVRVTVARFEGDTRKDYFTKVTTGNWKSYIDTIRQFGK